MSKKIKSSSDPQLSSLPYYEVSVYNFSVIAFLSVACLTLALTGALGQKRDCNDGAALPSGWDQDLTYRKPYLGNTIPYWLSFIFVILLFPLLIAKSPLLLSERSLWKQYSSWKEFGMYTIIVLSFYGIGIGISGGIGDILKGQLCSLRPSAGLRTDDPESYLSTPSTHASASVFTAVYVSYWFLKNISDPILKVVFCMVMSIYPFIVSATRITDNKHWTVDVVAGSIIAIAVAFPLLYVIENLRVDNKASSETEPLLKGEA